jgi:threonine dehydrogenase-like Zn-dependent dehydrogenase
MRAPFQEGDFPAPVKYGYMNVGLVEEGPETLRGRHVFVLFPHQTRYVVPAAWAHPLPEDVPPRRGVLAANLETAVNGVWDARPHVGDRIAVIGAGTVGCLVAWLAARIAGCRVQLVDVNPARANVARRLGVPFASPADAEAGVDLVVHASGSPDGLALALGLAGTETPIVELSWYGDRAVPVPLGEAFHANRLTIISSQVGRIAPAQRARWDTRRRMELVLDFLRDASLDALLTGESQFDALPQTMGALVGSAGDTLCHVVRYD